MRIPQDILEAFLQMEMDETFAILTIPVGTMSDKFCKHHQVDMADDKPSHKVPGFEITTVMRVKFDLGSHAKIAISNGPVIVNTVVLQRPMNLTGFLEAEKRKQWPNIAYQTGLFKYYFVDFHGAS